MNKTEYHAIDIGRFICAILIVMIHVPIYNATTYVEYAFQNCLTRVAVPLFFVMSGFFLRKKSMNGANELKVNYQYVMRILRLYITWSLIYLPLTIRDMLDDWDGFAHEIMVYVRNFIFVGTYTQLWYLSATIWAVIIISILIRFRRNVQEILGIGLCLYIIGLFAQSWFGLIVPLREAAPSIWKCLRLFGKMIGTTRNGLFEGFFFMGMGYWLATNDITIKKGVTWVLYFISMCLLFVEILTVEYFRLVRERDMYLSLIFVSYFGFILLRDMQLNDHWCYSYLRKISSLIFYLHVGVREIFIMIFAYVGVTIETPGVLFSCVIIITFVLAVTLIQLSEKRVFFLKRLYC